MTSLPLPLQRFRRTVGDDVRTMLAAEPLPPQWFDRSPSDPGLFDRDAVVWRVHADRCGLVGGLRALLLQTMHPLAMAGVAQHSDYRHDPWGRLQRTGAFIAVTTYGSTSAAEATIARVRRIHARIEGVAGDGRPYRADDPHLLAWVHLTEVDSFLRAYRRYGSGAPLTPEDADRYVAEMAGVGTRLGVVDPPETVAGLRQALIAYRPELAATPPAHEAVRFLLWPPLPAYLRPGYGVLCAAAVGLLPGFVRHELRLPTAPLSDPLLVRPTTRAVLAALGAVLGTRPPAAELAEASARTAASPEATPPSAGPPESAPKAGEPPVTGSKPVAGGVSAGGSNRPAARRSRPAGPAKDPVPPTGPGSPPARTAARRRTTRPATPPTTNDASEATPKASPKTRRAPKR